ncbi:tetratricopeptide repeat protein [Roseofilum casamattae]|uniref:Tetratricopeptide repeat protein n=1 Tax=Roseofilum casamattae BLCC-M143 TaxID=3022442 RepID=A0ABT7BXF0_9CYAN|nr:serine protease [Roseofilum casamattae]MDJ1183873.1 tetratricopeptide repeat protein [Roseofilum casamattae BLCC-M143]
MNHELHDGKQYGKQWSRGIFLSALLVLLGSQTAWGQSLEDLFRQAEAARREGDYQGAEQIWRQAIEQDPDNAPAYLGLGNRLRDLNKVEEAIAAYEKAIELDPNYAFAYVGLGNALRVQSQFESAKVQYETAIELNPNLPGVYWNLGNVLLELEEIEEAIAQFRIALKLKADSVPVYNDLAAALLARGSVEEAIATYQKAVDLDSRYGSTYTGLGAALGQNNQLPQAIEAYQRAIELNQFDRGAYVGLANIYAEQKNWQRAIEHYQTAAKLEPNYSVFFRLGYAWQQQENVEEAIAAYEEAIAQDPNGVLAHYNLQELRRSLALQSGSEPVNEENEVSASEEDIEPENDALSESIVRIITPIPEGVNIGTGWVVRRQENTALIVTNRDAIAHASSLENNAIQVEFLSPSTQTVRQRYGAKLIHITPEDSPTNVAILEVEGIPETIQPLATSTAAEPSMLSVIGHPFNANPWTTREVQLNSTSKPLTIEGNMAQGYAGSPVLNEEGAAIATVGKIGNPSTEDTMPLAPAIAERAIIYPMALIEQQLKAWGIDEQTTN